MDLKLSDEEFSNCTIASGSVLVSFILHQTIFNGNHTLKRLNVMVGSNIFNVEVNGTKLNTSPSSVTLNGVVQEESSNTPPPVQQRISDDDDDDDTGMLVAIVILVLIIIIIIIVLIILLLLIRNRKHNKVRI